MDSRVIPNTVGGSKLSGAHKERNMSENSNEEVNVGYIGEVFGHKVFEGTFNSQALRDLIGTMSRNALTELTTNELHEKQDMSQFSDSNDKREDADFDEIDSETGKEFELTTADELEDEDEELYEVQLFLHSMYSYIQENLDNFFGCYVFMIILEGALAGSIMIEEEVKINESIAKAQRMYRQVFKRRLRSYISRKGPISKRKAHYARSYPRFLEAWQQAEDIYSTWLAEAKRLNRGILKDEDLKGTEWKRRIRAKLADIADMPEDLLNRFVREDRSPLFISGLNDYSRIPSQIAAIHTARYCNLPDNLSYERYMQIRREGANLLRVTGDTPNDDPLLAE
jgi:hypothetical protein